MKTYIPLPVNSVTPQTEGKSEALMTSRISTCFPNVSSREMSAQGKCVLKENECSREMSV